MRYKKKVKKYVGGGSISAALNMPGPAMEPYMSTYRFVQPFYPSAPKADRSKYQFDNSKLADVKGHTNAVNWFTNKVNSLQSEMASLSDIDILTNSPRAAQIIQEYNQLVNPATINAIKNDYDRTQEGKSIVNERKANNAYATTAEGGIFVLDRSSGKPKLVSISEMANNRDKLTPITISRLLTYKDENPDMVLNDQPHFALESTYGLNFIVNELQGRLKNLGERKSRVVNEGIAKLNDHISNTSIPALAKTTKGWKSNRKNLQALEDTWFLLEAPMQAQLKANVARQFPPPDGEKWSEREITDMAKLLMVKAIFDPAIVEEFESGLNWSSSPTVSSGGRGSSGGYTKMSPVTMAAMGMTNANTNTFTDPDPSNPINYEIGMTEFDIVGKDVPNNIMLTDEKISGIYGGSNLYALDGTKIDPRRAKRQGDKAKVVIIPTTPDGKPAPVEVLEAHQRIAKEYVEKAMQGKSNISAEERSKLFQEANQYALSKVGSQYELRPKVKMEAKYAFLDNDPAKSLIDKKIAKPLNINSYEDDKIFKQGLIDSGLDIEADDYLNLAGDDIVSLYVYGDLPTVSQAREQTTQGVEMPRAMGTAEYTTQSTLHEPFNRTNFNTTSRENL